MDRRYIIKWLVAPLIIAVVVAIILHLWLDWAGFFVNLASELIGIIITVCYIDYVIRRRDERRSAGARQVLQERLDLFANQTASSITQALGLAHQSLQASMPSDMDVTQFQRNAYQFARTTVADQAQTRLTAFAAQQWQCLFGTVTQLQQECNSLLATFFDIMEPETRACLLRIQTQNKNIIRTQHDLGAVISQSDEQLQQEANGFGLDLKQRLVQTTADQVRAVLKDACVMGEELLPPAAPATSA